MVAQLVKNSIAIWETWALSLGLEDPLEKGKAIHSSVLAWRIPSHKESTVTRDFHPHFQNRITLSNKDNEPKL